MAANHPFIHFPEGDPAGPRYAILSGLRIETPYSLDWEVARTTGLQEQIAPFTSYRYRREPGHHFTCHGWSRLFQISEPIYRELTLEFFSTVSFDTTELDFTRPVFRFRLGGLQREISVIELACRVGIYTPEETARGRFLRFLSSTLVSPPEDYSETIFWSEIADGHYQPGSARESSIRSPVFRLLHRLIASTIHHRAGNERVPSTDLFYLWCLITPRRCLNLPYALGVFLARAATGSRTASPICGGHFITRLARSYQLLTPDIARDLIVLRQRPLTALLLVSMGILQRGQGDAYEIPGHEPPQQPQQPQPRPPRRRRAPPPPAQTDPQPEIDIRYLAERIEAIEQSARAQRDWMGEQMTLFFAQQGFQPSRPYPYLPSGADGAGPSGTQHDDDEGDA